MNWDRGWDIFWDKKCLLNCIPEQLHEDDRPVDEVDLLLEEDEVVDLRLLVRPRPLHELDYLALHVGP